MKVCPSKFTAYAQVFSRDESDDTYGGQTVTWSSRAYIWCMVSQSNANEALDQDGLRTQRRVSFFTIYRTDILVTDRIELDSLAHNVTSLTRVDQFGKPDYIGKFLKIDTDSSTFYSV